MTEQPDWQRILLRVGRVTDLSLEQLARRSGVGAHTLARIQRGEAKEPRWSVGMALIAMAGEYLPDEDLAQVFPRQP
jgi:transcriptional regulator with XRE-family HTH domain